MPAPVDRSMCLCDAKRGPLCGTHTRKTLPQRTHGHSGSPTPTLPPKACEPILSSVPHGQIASDGEYSYENLEGALLDSEVEEVDLEADVSDLEDLDSGSDEASDVTRLGPGQGGVGQGPNG